MSETFRKISPSIWNDLRFMSLSPNARLMFLYILTHPGMTSLGLMRATREGLCAELGICQSEMSAIFSELSGMVAAEPAFNIIHCPNFLRYNPPANPNVVSSWKYACEHLPECPLVERVIENARAMLKSRGEKFLAAFVEAFGERGSSAINQSLSRGEAAGMDKPASAGGKDATLPGQPVNNFTIKSGNCGGAYKVAINKGGAQGIAITCPPISLSTPKVRAGDMPGITSDNISVDSATLIDTSGNASGDSADNAMADARMPMIAQSGPQIISQNNPQTITQNNPQTVTETITETVTETVTETIGQTNGELKETIDNRIKTIEEEEGGRGEARSCEKGNCAAIARDAISALRKAAREDAVMPERRLSFSEKVRLYEECAKECEKSVSAGILAFADYGHAGRRKIDTLNQARLMPERKKPVVTEVLRTTGRQGELGESDICARLMTKDGIFEVSGIDAEYYADSYPDLNIREVFREMENKLRHVPEARPSMDGVNRWIYAFLRYEDRSTGKRGGFDEKHSIAAAELARLNARRIIRNANEKNTGASVA